MPPRKGMRGVVLLALLALLALALVAFSLPLLSQSIPGLSKEVLWSAPRCPRGLTIVPAIGVQAAVLLLGSEPWWVQGLWRTPDLPDWDSWDIDTVRILASPTGTFGSYGKCERDAAADSAEPWGVSFQSEHCRSDKACEPRHFVRDASISEAARVFADPASSGASHVYLRGIAGIETRRAAGKSLGVRLLNLSPYLSSAGAATNLHWDATAGILAQTEGEKDVALFSPGTMPSEARDGPCHRRSYESGEICPAGALLKLRLTAGWGLFIPSKWGHHVKSLSPRTLGAVWRLGSS